jgi:hypothetical protein
MEQVIIEIQVDNNDASKKLLEVEKALQKNKQRQDELRKSIKQARAEGKEASEEELLELAKVEQSVKQLSSARNTYSKVLASESNTLKALRAEVSKLNLERENLDTSTVEGAKRFTELTKTLKEYNEQINEASKASGNFKDNIGNYEESVKNAINETSIFGVKIGDSGSLFNDLGAKVKGAGQAFLSFGKALLANPIFLLASILAGVVAAFLSTEKGVKKLEVALAPLKSVFNAIYSAIAQVGEIAFTVIELLSDGFGAIADLFGADSKGAKQLVKDLQAVEAQQAKIEAQVAQQKADAEKLRTIRDNERLTDKERLKASEDLLLKLKEREKTEIGFLDKKIALAKRELEQIPENLRTQEQIDKVLLLQKEKQDAIADIAGQYTEQITSQKGILDQINERLVTQVENQLRLDLATGKVREGSVEQLNKEIEAIERKAKIQKSNVTDVVELGNIELAKQAEIAEKRKEFQDKQVEQFQEFQDKQKELRDKAFSDEIARLELSLAKTEENTKEQLRAFADLQRRKAEIEITQSEASADQAKLIRFNAEKAIEDNAIATFDKLQALRDADLEKQKEFLKKEEDARAQYNQIILQGEIDTLNKSNELAQKALNEELARLENDFATKRDLLTSFTKFQIDNIKTETELKLEARQESFNLELENFDLESEEFKVALAQFELDKSTIIAESEANLTGIREGELQKRQEINRLEKESEIAKANSILGLASTVAGALDKETIAGKFAAFAQAQINAFITASNVLKTVSTFASPPVPQIAAVAAFGLAQRYASQINSINTGVQNVATAFNPSLKFAEGGRVPQGFELPYSTPKGDNTLVLVKPQEAILTVGQQQKLGGATALARAGVPGFNTGGLVGSSTQQIDSNFSIQSFVNAIAKIPAPIVSVQEITDTQKQVKVKEVVSSL